MEIDKNTYNLFGYIIPAYNEYPYIENVLNKLLTLGIERDNILVIDDSSNDETPRSIKKFRVNCISHGINKGKGAGIIEGIKFFFQRSKLKEKLKGVFIIDGDGQHPPVHIKDFIKLYLEKRSDLIIGKREFSPKKMPIDRIISNTLTSFFISLVCRKRIYDSQSGYRFLSKKFALFFKPKDTRFLTESEMIIQAAKEGFKIDFVDIETVYNKSVSKINRFSDTLRFIKWYFKDAFFYKKRKK